MTSMEYENKVLFAVPRDAFLFLDTPHTWDYYLHSSFRHEVMIPDNMFPEAWINKKCFESDVFIRSAQLGATIRMHFSVRYISIVYIKV
jgi:hypothetical protein